MSTKTGMENVIDTAMLNDKQRERIRAQYRMQVGMEDHTAVALLEWLFGEDFFNEGGR